MNVLPSTPETKLPFLAPTEKGWVIHVSIKPAGEIPSTVGGIERKPSILFSTLSWSA